MSNINFDNPLLLLIGIPLLLAVIVPFLLAVRRRNANFHNIGVFVCNILLVLAATLALAGMKYDATVTETNVYVLADVSYSANNNLDVLDGYVQDVKRQLPKNSKMSLIAFGRNYQVLSNFGDELVSVRTADEVETDGTDIAGAIRYVGALLEDDVINHIVVITDGKETAGSNDLTSIVSKLNNSGVYIDVIYLNDNLTEDQCEIQLTDVTYTSSAFVGRKEYAELEVYCNNEGQTRVYFDVECNGKTTSHAHALYKGVNTVSIALDTESSGKFAYTITVRSEKSTDDTSPYNNSCLFTQTVSDDVRVLFIGGSALDCVAGQKIYGTENVKYVFDPSSVPFTVEELCEFDEIVLSNFDIRTMTNRQQFIAALNSAVSKFGKTLTTYGNTYVQEGVIAPDASLDSLSGMLPVSVGNSDQNDRLVVILMDISLSTNFSNRTIIRTAASKIIETLNIDDKVCLIGFSDSSEEIYTGTLWDKEVVYTYIDESLYYNGTYLESALNKAAEAFDDSDLHNRELIIISDGLLFTDNKAKCIAIAENLSASNVNISAISVFSNGAGDATFLRGMVQNKNASGKGFYKEIAQETDIDIVFGELVEDVSEVCIEGGSYSITLRRPQEDVLSGVGSLPNISGFWYGKEKTGATVVATITYYRDKLHSEDIPLYSYWSYGIGRVATVLTDITSSWTSSWTSEDAQAFLENICLATLPDERIDSPFLVSAEISGDGTHLTVGVPNYHRNAILTANVTRPDGTQITRIMSYDSENYVCDLGTAEPGRYSVQLIYDYTTLHYEFEYNFAISRYDEYNSLTAYTVASLYRIISDNGEVSLDGTLTMDHSDSAVRTYTFSFVIPLMIACAILFVLGIAIRLIKLNDIRYLFVRKRKNQNI